MTTLRPSQRSTPSALHRVAGVMALAVGLSGWVEAAKLVTVTVEELASVADTVVHGRVEAVKGVRAEDGRVQTRIELAVESVWKGTDTNRLGVVQGSAVVGEQWVQVVGEPEFRLGEEVVVFTVRNPAGDAVLVHLSQGKFSVRRTDGAAGPWVTNGHWGASPARPKARLPHQVPLDLSTLRERVTRTGSTAGGGQ